MIIGLAGGGRVQVSGKLPGVHFIAVYGIYLRSCLYTLGRTVKIQSGQPCYCIWFHEPSVWCTFICSGTGGDCAGIFCKQPCGTDPGMYRNLYSK